MKKAQTLKNSYFFILGINSIICQIIFLRIWLSTFYGNEILIGIFLASWAAFTGAGSLIIRKLPNKLLQMKLFFFALQTILATFILAEYFLFLWIKTNYVPGSVLPPSHILIFILLLLPHSIILGLQFPAGVSLLEENEAIMPSLNTNYGYLLESAGFIAGGILYSFLLVKFLNNLNIILLIVLVNILFSLVLISRGKKHLLITLLITIALLPAANKYLKKFYLSLENKNFAGYKIIAVKDTPYSQLIAARFENQYMLFQNNQLLLTNEDYASAEELVHWGLLCNPNPQKILLIGGTPEITKEAFKHPVKTIYFVELDPEVIHLIKNYFPEDEKKILSDARIKLIYTDARLFLNTAKEKFDAIVCNLPSPYNALLNKFYTKEFYEEIYEKLNENGTLIFSSGSAEGFPSPETMARNNCILNSLERVFNNHTILPGDKNIFMASKSKENVFSANYILDNYKKRKIKTLFFSPKLVKYKLSPDNKKFILKQFAARHIYPENRDLKPICYTFDLILWGSLFSKYAKNFFSSLLWFGMQKFLIILFILSLILVFTGLKKKILTLTFFTGFCTMALEIVIVFLFQILYGGLYQYVGTLFALFMLGNIIGIITANKTKGVKSTQKHIIVSFTLIILLSILIMLFVKIYSFLNLPTLCLVLFLANLASGFILGLFFGSAAKIYITDKTKSGLIYAMDIAGGGLGALITSSILIPAAGILGTAFLIGLTALLICALFYS